MHTFTDRVIERRDVALSELAANPANFRRHPEAQRVAVETAMADVGVLSAALFNRRTGRLIDGHLRVDIARANGATTFPADVVDLSPSEERVALATLDATTYMADIDDDALSDLLAQIAADDEFPEMIDAVPFDDLFPPSDHETDPATGERVDVAFTALKDGADPDDVPDVDDAPTMVESGDVWMLGRHRLVCGDATDPAVWSKLLAGDAARPAMVFTDPPYGTVHVGRTADKLTIANDDLPDADLGRLVTTALRHMIDAAADGAAVYVCHPHMKSYLFQTAFVDAGWRLSAYCVWVKDQFVLGRSDYHWRHEAILYGWKPTTARRHPLVSRSESTVWEFNRPTRSTVHPTMKPVDLVSYGITNSSDPGDIVVDGFAGAGSTLMACHVTGRTARVVELAPRYCDVILRRFTDATGIAPNRIAGRDV